MNPDTLIHTGQLIWRSNHMFSRFGRDCSIRMETQPGIYLEVRVTSQKVGLQKYEQLRDLRPGVMLGVEVPRGDSLNLAQDIHFL